MSGEPARPQAILFACTNYCASANKPAAVRTVKVLAAAPGGLPAHPRIGERLEEFDPREVRRILVGQYEIRYEIQQPTIYILRLWHTRESRQWRFGRMAVKSAPGSGGSILARWELVSSRSRKPAYLKPLREV